MGTPRPSKPPARKGPAPLAPARPAPTTTTPSGPVMGCRPLGRWWTCRSPAAAGEGEELRPGTGVLAQQPAQGRSGGPRAEGPDPAQGHAQVLGLDDDADAARRERL